tara:strand:+ start:554 stop:796 length:243 start_codon:yes stop_codon:yes gene_type:complete
MANKKKAKVLSPKELEKLREKTYDFFEEQIPVLSIQCEVEELKARISEARFKTLEFKIKFTQLTHEVNQSKKDAESKTDK